MAETVLAGFGRASQLAVRASFGDQSAGNARGLMSVVAFTDLSTWPSGCLLAALRVDIHALTYVDRLGLIAGRREQFSAGRSSRMKVLRLAMTGHRVERGNSDPVIAM